MSGFISVANLDVGHSFSEDMIIQLYACGQRVPRSSRPYKRAAAMLSFGIAKGYIQNNIHTYNKIHTEKCFCVPVWNRKETSH